MKSFLRVIGILCALGLATLHAQPTQLDGIPIHSAFASVNGVKIHYVSAGHGPAVVLLHGYPETWYDWRLIIPKLAANYTVIAPDMRGLGDSSRPADGDYTKKSVAEDIYLLVG